MTYQVQRFETHHDERGRLLPIELDEVPFPVRRVFTVHGPEYGAVRGEHRTPCNMLIVVTSGAASLELGPDQDNPHVVELEKPGDAVRLVAGDYVRYSLPDDQASILVLAAEPYGPR